MKKIISILFASLVLFGGIGTINAQGENYSVVTMDQMEVTNHKVFRVEFNTKLSIEDVNDQTIFIMDSKGNRHNVVTGLMSDEKTVIIAPLEAYQKNKVYYLIIMDEITSKKGVKANTIIKQPFIVSEK